MSYIPGNHPAWRDNWNPNKGSTHHSQKHPHHDMEPHVQSVPEPGTFFLFGLILVTTLLMISTRRRK